LDSPQPLFPIVGVGASAGGIEALEGLFRGMPRDPGVALVVVTHLNPERESILHEVIARYTSLGVVVAADGAEVKPNCVYVLPSAATVGVAGGKLTVSKSQLTAKRERKPIDIFFSSLAVERGEDCAGIILSGGDGDGTLGVKAIKERGGLTLAQTLDGFGPAHPEMPETAIATGLVDFAIPVEEMGARLAEFARRDGPLAAVARSAKGEVEAARDEICDILKRQVGHEFSGYKSKTFLRRVQRRMHVTQADTLGAYTDILRRDTKEVNALFRDLLINVTNFFRDADSFEALKEKVVPKLFEGRGGAEFVRVWVPGCATGEEVYSVAMLLREHRETLIDPPRVQIFATDIDERALHVARAARYPAALLESVTEQRRRRFFHPDGGSFVVSKDVRDLCIFSPHSVLRDPPFSRIDLVSCRNLLIYFGPDAQNQVIPTFHYALRPSGYLFLGTSENVSQFGDLFGAVDKKHRIFRCRNEASSQVRLPLSLAQAKPSGSFENLKQSRSALAAMTLRQAVDAQVLDRFAPAHVVVTRDGDVVHYSGKTGRYLEAAAGAPTRQLLNMARKGLRLELRTLLREAVETSARAVRRGIAIEDDDGETRPTRVTIEPLDDRNGSEPLYVVLFDEEVLPAKDKGRRPAEDGSAAQIENELKETRERLQSLVEEYETALEELKSSNEELVSVNEELQSTNEELEASKEELQSVNEELSKVNFELSTKVEAFDRANSDLQNLFDSTDIATLFLDRELIIRSFTPSVAKVFSILPTDRGRPITDLASRLPLPSLVDDVAAVMADGATRERRIASAEGAQYLVRLGPYHDIERGIGGAVMSFTDISRLAASEAHQQTLIAELNHRVKNMLAVVVGIARQTEAAGGVEFAKSFIDRMLALGRAYELLSRDKWKDAQIDEIVRQELEPFGLRRYAARGPSIELSPRHAISLGMMVHELATNAAKYGALSNKSGVVDVEWSNDGVGENRTLELRWNERGGPAVKPPERTGFGLNLIERECGYTLGGEAQVDFRPEGARATIRFPYGREERV